MKNKSPQVKPQQIIIGFVILLAGITGVLFYQNRTNLFDWFAGLSYSPTPEVSALEESVNLTDSAKRILHATHPSLESRDDFNVYCDSHNSKVSVLGCYTNNRIYLYDINESSLAGVKESTLAHELLHAVWARMSDSEKDRISTLLTEVYNNEQYHSLLAEDLETYEESNRMDELHSRIGTEIVELPEELEAHYAKYFKDQDAIVMYFNDYITPFRELSQKIKELSDKLTSLDVEIQEKSKSYHDLAEELSADIDKFNQCTNETNCFASTSAFQNARNELLSRKSSLEELFEQTNNLIKQYNDIVKEYNDNIMRGETLENLINSNATVEEIK